MVSLASTICNCPISLISLVDENRQWFKAEVGLGTDTTGRDVSFCAHVVASHEPKLLVVGNALEDERFAKNPL